MSRAIFPVEQSESEEIAQLRQRVRALEIRLERVERGQAAAVLEVEEDAPAPRQATPVRLDTETAAATIFKRIAMLCFVLLGALILRVLTQQNILGPRFGTVLGFAYTAHLLVLAVIPGRFGGFARENSVFQCSGAILALVIAIESAVRTATMGRVGAMMAIGGVALLAVVMGLRGRKAPLVATGILGAILALVALDLNGHDAPVQLGLVALLTGAAIAISWREDWGWLRLVTLLLVMGLMPAGFFFCGKEPGLAPALLASSAGIWCLLVGQHFLARRPLGDAAAWLPVGTLWLTGLEQFCGWPYLGPTTGGIAVFALAGAAVCGRRLGADKAGIKGLITTAALAGVIGAGTLDHTGLLCALFGAGLWLAVRRAASDWAAVCTTLLMLAAAGLGLTQLFHAPVASGGLLAMGISAAVLITHYIGNGHAGAGPNAGLQMRLAPLCLAGGLALLLGLVWELLNRSFQQPAQLLLSQTVAVVLTALALTFWGHAARRRAPLLCGLACMGIALIKVLLMDMLQLKSLNMLASLVLVSLASVAVSLILRRRNEPATSL